MTLSLASMLSNLIEVNQVLSQLTNNINLLVTSCVNYTYHKLVKTVSYVSGSAHRVMFHSLTPIGSTVCLSM